MNSVSSKKNKINKQCSRKLSLLHFSFGEIKCATNGFSDKNFLGEGRLGKVYRGKIREKRHKRVVGVRHFHKESEIKLQSEIDLMSSSHHDNIMSLVGYCEEQDEKILVYEFMPNGSLLDYLFKDKNRSCNFTVKERLKICIGIAEGFGYLHSHTPFNIIHGDVKTANILLDGNLVVKFSDFGLSTTRPDGPSTAPQIMDDLQGTNVYLAPECYEPNYKLCKKADVYAFGVVLLEVLCERPAWKNLIVFLALPFLMKRELPAFTPEHVKTMVTRKCSGACANLVLACLDNIPDKRPTMNQVIDELLLALKLQKQQLPHQQVKRDLWLSSKRLSLEDIKKATKDFAMDNLLEEGTFWKSYRGYISGKRYNGVVSVKRINKESEHGNSTFQKEVELLTRCKDHVNIIFLVGYCEEENEKIIVYKFMANGSLYNYLYNDQDDTHRLTMEQHLNICIGVAHGLSYLHETFENVHCNLSTNNILLDHNFVPSISGFELLMAGPASPFSSPAIMDYKQGTEGYLAPECSEPNYQPDPKADVYAFGMLLLECLRKKPPWKSLVILAFEFAMKRELPRFRDEHLDINISPECSRSCENLIRDCLDIDPGKRPSMRQVVDELGLALILQKSYWNGKANSQQSSQLKNQSSSSSCHSFLLSDIRKATNNFSNYLGEGAFGKVYSGNISGNSYNGVVAVKHNKRISRVSITRRLEICIGVAEGLYYLHSRTDSVIIHSDLKTDNILLDKNLVPKISDFGLSRTRDAGPSTSKQTTNNIKGTEGYLAPECYEPKYQLSRKADVYAFGVVLLEVLCERPAWQNLVILALPFIRRGELPNFTPEYVVSHISPRCSRACEHLIRDCLDTDPVNRPDMYQVITKLKETLRLQKKYSKDHLLPFTDPQVFSSSFDLAVLYHNYTGA